MQRVESFYDICKELQSILLDIAKLDEAHIQESKAKEKKAREDDERENNKATIHKER